MTSAAWRRSGFIDESVVAGLPEWMSPLIDAVPTVTTGEVTRFVPTDGEGRHAAVLILFSAERDVVLIERARGGAVHSGQPAFPGGAVEPDDADAKAAALRESREEIGVDPDAVTIFGLFPDLWVPVSDFVVSPVLGFLDRDASLSVQDPTEVSRVERVALETLSDPANRVTVVHPSGYRGPGFTVHDMLVWGFTAGVLDSMLDKAGWSTPWPVEREVAVEL